MLGMHSCEMSLSSTLEGGGHIRTSIRSRKIKIDFAILNSMYRLRMPISTAYSMCEANKSTAQPKDDDLTEHYEFNWCLRSPLGGRLLMQSVTQYHHDVLRTRCEGGPTGGGNTTPPAGGPTKKWTAYLQHGTQKAARQIYCIPSPHPLPPAPRSCCDYTRIRLLANSAIFRQGFCIMSRALAFIYDRRSPPH